MRQISYKLYYDILQPPGYADLETFAKEATDILEELADKWDCIPHKGDAITETFAVKNRIETIIRAAKKLGL